MISTWSSGCTGAHVFFYRLQSNTEARTRATPHRGASVGLRNASTTHLYSGMLDSDWLTDVLGFFIFLQVLTSLKFQIMSAVSKSLEIYHSRRARKTQRHWISKYAYDKPSSKMNKCSPKFILKLFLSHNKSIKYL